MKKHLVTVVEFIKRTIALRSILELKKRNLLSGFIPTLLLGYDYQSLKFEYIEHYSLIHPEKLEFLFNTPVTLSYSPPRFDNEDSETCSMHEIEGFNNYAVLLKDVEVIGGSNVIILDQFHALYDLKYLDYQNKYYYSDQGIRYYHKDDLIIKTIKSNHDIEAAIFLGRNFSWNYYHLLYEVIVKFQKINEMDIDISIPILVDKIIMDIPQFLELVSVFNNKNRKIISLDKGKRYKVKKLYYFSCPNIIPPDFINVNNIQSEDALFDLNALAFLRLNLLSHASNTIFPKRIFISRSKASGRRKFNEDEVFDVFVKYGFVKVFPENYSLFDQITLFNTADFIAGGAGAAFTNLLFCKKLSKVITFAKTKSLFSGFSTIAKYVGVDMILFTEEFSESLKAKGTHDSFTIDTIRLNTLIKEWL